MDYAHSNGGYPRALGVALYRASYTNRPDRRILLVVALAISIFEIGVGTAARDDIAQDIE
jgi:hypothetical protein